MPRYTNKRKVNRHDQRIAKRARMAFEAILAEHYGIYSLEDLRRFPASAPPDDLSEQLHGSRNYEEVQA